MVTTLRSSRATGWSAARGAAHGHLRHLQILFHAQLREELPPLRDVADAECGAALHRLQQKVLRRLICRLPGHAAAHYRQMPHDAVDQRGLAHAVAPEQHGALAARQLQVDVPQGVVLTVELIDRSQAQHLAFSS